MKRLHRTCPSAMNVDPAGVKAFLQALDGLNCHQVMVARDNVVIAEGYWAPYREGFLHIAYSVSKSFTCTAVGMAVDEGLLTEDDLVLSFFEDQLPAPPCENMRKLRVRHLLTMSTGISNERAVQDDELTWLQRQLYNYVDQEPGSRFCYNSGSTYVLSCILRKVTGQNVFDYLKPRLFEPMGFAEDIWWEQSPQGINTCFNGFNATVEDLTKLGLLYLNDGVWEGKRLLSSEWVRKASALQIDNSDNNVNQRLGFRQGFGHFTQDYRSGYGYLFWHCAHEGAYRGDGIYGQLCIIMPRERMVVSMLSGHPEPGELLEAVWTHLAPAVDNISDTVKDTEVTELAKGLHLAMPQGSQSSAMAQVFSGVTWRFPQNGLGIETMCFYFGLENRVELTTCKGTFSAPVGYGEWINARSGYDPEHFSCDNQFFYDHVGCCGAWEDNVFSLRIAYTQTPFVDQMRVRFLPNCVEVHFWHTVKMYQMKHFLIGVPEAIIKARP